ncbi:hypothetical protein V5F89_04650 [Pelagerythrobacter marensis]|uniref:Uncharacterized protein n=1 Tax=Pelagerythrobacter marensis TaxID=543877 RepID=A0ABZ2D9Z9_9SPHN
MKHRILPALAALTIATAGPALAEEPSRGEARLAEMLEGRVAGEPVHCLHESQRDSIQIVDRTAIVFRDGATLWVNRPSGARMLSNSDLPVFHQYGTQICRHDRVELRDRIGGVAGPILILDSFVPYTKAGGDKSHEKQGG